MANQGHSKGEICIIIIQKKKDNVKSETALSARSHTFSKRKKKCSIRVKVASFNMLSTTFVIGKGILSVTVQRKGVLTRVSARSKMKSSGNK